jgi:hypothetical protein
MLNDCLREIKSETIPTGPQIKSKGKNFIDVVVTTKYVSRMLLSTNRQETTILDRTVGKKESITAEKSRSAVPITLNFTKMPSGKCTTSTALFNDVAVWVT